LMPGRRRMTKGCHRNKFLWTNIILQENNFAKENNLPGGVLNALCRRFASPVPKD
jgi:hypothetical protein